MARKSHLPVPKFSSSADGGAAANKGRRVAKSQTLARKRARSGKHALQGRA